MFSLINLMLESFTFLVGSLFYVPQKRLLFSMPKISEISLPKTSSVRLVPQVDTWGWFTGNARSGAVAIAR